MAFTAAIDLTKYAKNEDVVSRISSNLTLYLSPTGSDDTGDGTSGNPWFSIKRALDHLNSYRIDNDVFVTIQGSAGEYTYGNDEKAYIDHPDSSNISILFSNNYVSTTITGITYTPSGDRDSTLALTVTSASGFSPDRCVRLRHWTADESNTAFNGFFEVLTVVGNIVTIKYNGHYTSADFYNHPSTFTPSVNLGILQYDSEIISTCTSGNLIDIRTGLRQIRLTAIDKLTTYNHTLIYMNESSINVGSSISCNGFSYGIFLDNATILLSDYSAISNCNVGMYAKDNSLIEDSNTWVTNCRSGIEIYNSVLKGTSMGIGNNEEYGLRVHKSRSELSSYIVVNNKYGIDVKYSASMVLSYSSVNYNTNNSIIIDDNSTASLYDVTVYKANGGIGVNDGSSLRLTTGKIHVIDGTGIYVGTSSNAQINTVEITDTCNASPDGAGIFIINGADVSISGVDVHNNTQDGIATHIGSKCSIHDSTVRSNGGHGVVCGNGSTCNLYGTIAHKYDVADDTARLLLTSSQVSTNTTVYVTSTGKYWDVLGFDPVTNVVNSWFDSGDNLDARCIVYSNNYYGVYCFTNSKTTIEKSVAVFYHTTELACNHSSTIDVTVWKYNGEPAYNENMIVGPFVPPENDHGRNASTSGIDISTQFGNGFYHVYSSSGVSNSYHGCRILQAKGTTSPALGG